MTLGRPYSLATFRLRLPLQILPTVDDLSPLVNGAPAVRVGYLQHVVDTAKGVVTTGNIDTPSRVFEDHVGRMLIAEFDDVLLKRWFLAAEGAGVDIQIGRLSKPG